MPQEIGCAKNTEKIHKLKTAANKNESLNRPINAKTNHEKK